MRDITHKPSTLRQATAESMVFISSATRELIEQGRLPKGNLFDVARAAAFLGAKATPQLLPHCHPVAIDAMDVIFEFIDSRSEPQVFADRNPEQSGISITVSAKSIGRTGIEMEALTAASVAALEIYDMLKPVDGSLEIAHIRLIEKTGGKTDHKKYLAPLATCAILVCSDATYLGKREDNSGRKIQEMLKDCGAQVLDYKVVPDEIEHIQRQVSQWASQDIQLIFTTGGTGLGPRDVTVQALSELFDKKADGIAEAMRAHGQTRTPLAMMSQSTAGVIRSSLVITLPGSTNGVKECLEAILPAVFHARKMIMGGGH